jgi:sortase A
MPPHKHPAGQSEFALNAMLHYSIARARLREIPNLFGALAQIRLRIASFVQCRSDCPAARKLHSRFRKERGPVRVKAMLVRVSLHPPVERRALHSLLGWLSKLLLVAGLCALLAAGWALLGGKLYQATQKRQQWVEPGPAIPVATRQLPRATTGHRLLQSVLPKRDPLAIGELEVPRLGLDVVIREGVDDDSLRKAVGHLPFSALPGEAGNFVLLGHRDTFFRPLRGIERGDTIRVRAAAGSFVYKVESIQVTEPDSPGAVEQTREPVITLITCFPFEYIGSAPRRFIVRARLQR